MHLSALGRSVASKRGVMADGELHFAGVSVPCDGRVAGSLGGNEAAWAGSERGVALRPRGRVQGEDYLRHGRAFDCQRVVGIQT